MTICAAFMPGPEASATGSEVEDTISVRVLDEKPSVHITNPQSNTMISSLNGPISVSYTYLKKYGSTMTITYIDSEGAEHTETIIGPEDPLEGETGEISFPFREYGEKYGYGRYIISMTGEGLDGERVNDSVEFEYVAATGSVTQDDTTGAVNVDLDYDTDDPSLSDDEKVAKVVITITDENGNPIPGVDPITVSAPTKHYELPFEELGLPSGTYKIVVTPYNAKGVELYRSVALTLKYDEMVVPSTADTGGLFKGLNISSTDYLITGLGVFLVVGIGGIVFMSKRGKNTTKRRK